MNPDIRPDTGKQKRPDIRYNPRFNKANIYRSVDYYYIYYKPAQSATFKFHKIQGYNKLKLIIILKRQCTFGTKLKCIIAYITCKLEQPKIKYILFYINGSFWLIMIYSNLPL